jgi:uncharacterized protein (DUF433 family)
MAERPVSIRIPEEVRVAIAEMAGRNRRDFSSVANEMLDEAVKMRRVPGITFADEFEHREAKVGGTGLGVWEVIAAYQRMDEDWERFRKHYKNWLDEYQLRAALAYWRAFPEEIDGLIAESYSWTPEKLYSTYPFMKPPKPKQATKRIAER